jgi:Zn ribbon nucleic-acid-binding protein
MNNRRFKDGQETISIISEPVFNDPILIVCPSCGGRASVISFREDQSNQVRATCFNCGYNDMKSSETSCFYWHARNPTDGYFGHELWLKKDCSGHSLWAFNMQHLSFLESYVSATLRERAGKGKTGWSNSCLASRLPKWIKFGKNRQAILKAIQELKAMAV